MNDALEHLAAHDPVMQRLIETYPRPSFEKHENYYQELVDSIIGQQLSVSAARAIEGRFKDLFDGAFPSPEQILTVDIETLRGVGFSRPKARYVQDLAQKIIDGEVTFENMDDLTNDQIITELTQVKGIGEWTVHMFLMFCMARPDILPVGDLGIRNGVTALYGLDSQATPDDVARIAQTKNWRPYESVASWYVWQSLENKPLTSSS
jgi:DNA-3-methyladenine glycosylase II